MGKPAARIGDNHVCPAVNPGPVPHVGGPIAGPGVPTVIIGGMPAAVMGDTCICVGPPDTIAMGSSGVFIGGKPAARMGDSCAHGGAIVVGCPTVLVGETWMGGGLAAVAQVSSMKEAAEAGTPFCEKCEAAAAAPALLVAEPMTESETETLAQISTMRNASEDGSPFCEKCGA